MTRGPSNYAEAHAADEDRKAAAKGLVEAAREAVKPLHAASLRKWRALGFDGEPTSPPGFAFICLACGGWASLGHVARGGEFEGTSFTCPDCGQREVY